LSTRGVIARGMNRGWAGVYNHFDSYPTGQGRAIWASLHERFGGDADAFLRYAVDEHPAGWSSFCDGEAYGVEEVPGPGTASEIPFTEESTPFGIEWIYAVEPEDRALIVYKGGTWHEGRNHRLLGSFPLDGPEPDWLGLEADGRAMS
jgi:hypothetical protein